MLKHTQSRISRNTPKQAHPNDDVVDFDLHKLWSDRGTPGCVMFRTATIELDFEKPLDDDGELSDTESNANDEKRNSMHDNPSNTAEDPRCANNFESNDAPKWR